MHYCAPQRSLVVRTRRSQIVQLRMLHSLVRRWLRRFGLQLHQPVKREELVIPAGLRGERAQEQRWFCSPWRKLHFPRTSLQRMVSAVESCVSLLSDA